MIFVLLTWRSFSTNGWVSGYSRRFDDYVMFMLHICFLKAPFTWDAGVYSFFFYVTLEDPLYYGLYVVVAAKSYPVG